RQVAPLLYFELTGAEQLEGTGRQTQAGCTTAVVSALGDAVGSLLRRNDVVVSGPSARWFAALLVDRAVAARARAAVSDVDLGVVAARLRSAIQARLDALRVASASDLRVGVRAGWTIIEPRDGTRP